MARNELCEGLRCREWQRNCGKAKRKLLIGEAETVKQTLWQAAAVVALARDASDLINSHSVAQMGEYSFEP